MVAAKVVCDLFDNRVLYKRKELERNLVQEKW